MNGLNVAPAILFVSIKILESKEFDIFWQPPSSLVSPVIRAGKPQVRARPYSFLSIIFNGSAFLTKVINRLAASV